LTQKVEKREDPSLGGGGSKRESKEASLLGKREESEWKGTMSTSGPIQQKRKSMGSIL